MMANHLKNDWRQAELTHADHTLCAWAEKVTLTPTAAVQTDEEKLRAVGVSEQAVSDAAQVIGYFNYINRIADGLGVDLEPEMERETQPAERI